MADFAIMRTAKIKSKVGLARALAHNSRDKIPGNADEKKLDQNQMWGGRTIEVLHNFDEKLPEKIRKNAVMAIEVVMTASPTFNGDWNEYLKKASIWALETFGGEKNFLSAAIHYDESTPHIHLIFIPLKEGKLNAKYYLGGSRDRMTELQQDFWEKVGREFGLDRGRPREETRSEHTHHRYFDLESREKDINQKEIAVNVAGQALESREKDIKQKEIAVDVAGQALDRGGRIVATVIKAIQEIGDVSNSEKKQLWPELQERLPAVVSDIIREGRQKQLSTIKHNAKNEKSHGRN